MRKHESSRVDKKGIGAMESVIFTHQRTDVYELYMQSYKILNMLCILLENICFTVGMPLLLPSRYMGCRSRQRLTNVSRIPFFMHHFHFNGRKKKVTRRFYQYFRQLCCYASPQLPHSDIETRESQLKWIRFCRVNFNTGRQIELICLVFIFNFFFLQFISFFLFDAVNVP